MSDYHLELEEESHQDRRLRELCLEAARLVVDGKTRDEAVRLVLDRASARDEEIQAGTFVADADGNVDSFLDPDLDGDPKLDRNPNQIREIARDLYESAYFDGRV